MDTSGNIEKSDIPYFKNILKLLLQGRWEVTGDEALTVSACIKWLEHYIKINTEIKVIKQEAINGDKNISKGQEKAGKSQSSAGGPKTGNKAKGKQMGVSVQAS